MKMWKELLGFAIFLACFFPSTSRKYQPIELKALILAKPDSATRQHFPQRAERSVSNKFHVAKQNDGEIKPGSASRVHYAPELFGLTRRSANPDMFLQMPKVRFYSVFINSEPKINVLHA